VVTEELNTGCYQQTTPAVGFLFLTLPGGVALPCAPLIGAPGNTAGDFAGVDANGVAFSGSYVLTYTTAYHCSGGRGGCHTSFYITGGSVTFTE
jgi:hypothetical protein